MARGNAIILQWRQCSELWQKIVQGRPAILLTDYSNANRKLAFVLLHNDDNARDYSVALGWPRRISCFGLLSPPIIDSKNIGTSSLSPKLLIPNVGLRMHLAGVIVLRALASATVTPTVIRRGHMFPDLASWQLAPRFTISTSAVDRFAICSRTHIFRFIR